MYWDGYPFFHEGVICTILFWILVALVLFGLWKNSRLNREDRGGGFLKKRNARGETSSGKFERMKEDWRQ